MCSLFKKRSESKLEGIIANKSERIKVLTKENIALRFQLSEYIGKCHTLRKQLSELQSIYDQFLKEKISSNE